MLMIQRTGPVCHHFLRTGGGLLLALALVFSACQGKQERDKQVAREDSGAQSIDEPAQAGDVKYILFYGNSLTAGYLLEEAQSFPSLIQQRIDSLGLDYRVINAGLSGETTAGGVGRIDWVLQQPVDIFVLELGANDALRGLDVNETEANLRKIIETVRDTKGDIPVIIAGMLAPPNMGAEYTRRFNGIFPRLAEEYDAGLIPFLLEGVAADPQLNLPDGIHPNAEGQKIVMENVWQILKNDL